MKSHRFCVREVNCGVAFDDATGRAAELDCSARAGKRSWVVTANRARIPAILAQRVKIAPDFVGLGSVCVSWRWQSRRVVDIGLLEICVFDWPQQAVLS